MKQTFYIFILLLLSHWTGNAQNTLYVSTSGLDQPGRGTTLSNAYRSISYACAQAGTGDIILVEPGNYTFQNTILINKPVTIKNYGTGAVVLNGSGWTGSNPYMVNINSASHVLIQGIDFINWVKRGAAAIFINGQCDSVVIDRCKMRNIGWQSNDLKTRPVDGALDNAHVIHVIGDAPQPVSNLIIRNCSIVNCAAGFSEALTLTGYVTHPFIEYNTLDSIQNIGIGIAGNYFPPNWLGNPVPSLSQVRNATIRGNKVSRCMSTIAACAGIYIDGARDCIVEQNTVFECGAGISVGAERQAVNPVTGNIVRNNYVFNNVITGIVIGANDTTLAATNAVRNTVVANNLFYHNRSGAIINGIDSLGLFAERKHISYYSNNDGGELHLQTLDTLRLINNVIYPRNMKYHLVALSGYRVKNFTSDYNDYYRDDQGFAIAYGTWHPSLSAYRSVTGLDSNSLDIDPRLVNAGSNNPGLNNNSPLRDKGTPVYSAAFCGTRDYTGNNRVYNSRIDIGAIELQSPPTAIPGLSAPNGATTILYPNPASNILNIRHPVSKIMIRDMQGKTIGEFRPSAQRLDINHIPNGIYVAEIFDSNNYVQTQKIVIAR